MHGERSSGHLGAPTALLRIAASSLERPWRLFGIALVLFAAAVPWAARLYMDLRTDLRELLPKGAPAARALDALERRLGGFSHLSVVVECEDPASGKRFVDALGGKLRALVPSAMRDVRWRTDDDRTFFDAHGALYADIDDLEDLNAGLRAEVERAKRNANPLYFDLEDEEQAKDPRLERASEHLRKLSKERDTFPDGYLADAEEHTFVLLVYPTDAAVSLASNLRLFRTVDDAVRGLSPASFHPSIRVGYDGEVREVIEAQEHLVKDLLLSSAIVFLAVGAAIVLFYRSVRALFLCTFPLFTGAAVAYAASRFVIGYLNPNTAFLGSVIVGNGINPGILLLARYLEERRHGKTLEESLPIAIRGTWLGTFTACAAAAAGYGSLIVAGFRGFNQFAFMGSVGMLAVWASTYAFMPPLIVLAERRRPLVPPGANPREGHVARTFAAVLVRGAPLIVLFVSVLAAVSVALVVRFSHEPLEYDFAKLGSRQGRIDGAAYWAKRLDAVMKSYVAPTVVLTASEEHALSVARALRTLKEAQGPSSPIDRVTAIDDVIPSEQPRRVELLREIFGQITNRVLDTLSDDDRKLIEKLKANTVLAPITLADVPSHLARLFREKDGHVGRLVLVYPTLAATSEHGRTQIAFARSIRSAALAADPNAEVAGGLILTADIIESITHDGSIATLLSFAGVALLTIIVMRSLRDAVWVVGALCLGTLWMGGAVGALHIKLNFVNFVVLPITFGIGVDYAVNLYQRYREAGRGGAEAALAGSGGAVALCSCTTVIGYAALLVADYQAIFSFGLTAVLGEIACLSCALVSMPALLTVVDGLRRRSDVRA